MPEPSGSLINVAVEPKRQWDRVRLIAALETVARRDPDFRFSVDDSIAAIVLGGISESHLDTIVDELQTALGVALNIGSPQVAYRETISRPVRVDHTYKWQSGGSGQFARVVLAFERGDPGSGFVFDYEAGTAVPEVFVPGVVKGLEAARQAGVLAGFPLIDFRASLIDGAYHEVDSSAATFEIAARDAMRMLKEKRAVALLEPIMHVDVVTPDEFVGGVIGDLQARRGAIQHTEGRGDTQLISALVPLATMWGYVNGLRALSKGRGRFTQRFDHYEQVSRSLGDGPDEFPPAVGKRA